MTVALRPPREPLDPRVRAWWRLHCVLDPLVPAVVLLVLGPLVEPVAWFVPVAVALVACLAGGVDKYRDVTAWESLQDRERAFVQWYLEFFVLPSEMQTWFA